jgi:catechol 2,3-dioxygenase-like lactoylglutathione lyase family enzyme
LSKSSNFPQACTCQKLEYLHNDTPEEWINKMIFDHVGVRVKNVVQSGAFYDSTLGSLGIVRCSTYDGGAGFGRGVEPIFWISESPQGGGAHVAFYANSSADVEAFYEAGMKAGGKDNGAPGLRPDYGPHYFAAFLIDLDGNNIEAVYKEKTAL